MPEPHCTDQSLATSIPIPSPSAATENASRSSSPDNGQSGTLPITITDTLGAVNTSDSPPAFATAASSNDTKETNAPSTSIKTKGLLRAHSCPPQMSSPPVHRVPLRRKFAVADLEDKDEVTAAEVWSCKLVVGCLCSRPAASSTRQGKANDENAPPAQQGPRPKKVRRI